MSARSINVDNVSIKRSKIDKSYKDLWIVHGLGENSEYFHDVFTSELSKYFNIYIVDLPGYGNTPYLTKYKGINGAINLFY